MLTTSSPHPVMQTSIRYCVGAFSVSFLSLAIPLSGYAQSTTPAAAAAPATSGNEVITLQAFDVTSDAAHGYVASESVTGTRIASKLQDLPFAVNVVTSDFLKDFAAFDLKDQLAFVPGFSPSEVTGQYQLRGFSSSVSLVDGFRRIGLIDTVDIDRIEVIKGSAASIYGAIQPGGVINYITKQPTAVPSAEVNFAAGSDGLIRGSVSLSGPLLDPRLFYRIDVGDQTEKYSQEFASQRQASLTGKLLFKPSDATNIGFDFDYIDRYEHPFNQVLTVTEKVTMPWAGNNVTESQYFGMTTTGGLLNYNFAGPESYDHFRVTSGTFKVEHTFSDFWSLKFGANAFTNPYNDQLVGSGAYYPYGTGNVTVVNGVPTNASTPEVKDQPQVDWKPQRGGGGQLDNLFQFKTGPISNKLLVTVDYYELTQRTVTLVPTVNGSQATDYYGLYSPYSPSGAPYYVQTAATWDNALGYGWNTSLYGSNPSLYNGVTTDNWTASSDSGIFASERAGLFNDRLMLIVGGRYDDVRNQVANYNIPANSSITSSITQEPSQYSAFDYTTTALTYQLGASFKISDNLNVYANKSSAFNPQPQLDSYTGLALPNNKSNGWEYGFKGSLLNNRLNFTLARFEINEDNVVQSETDPISGQKDTILINLEDAKGYELNANYQITDNLLLLGSWGYTQTDIVQSDTLTFLEGLPARRVPRNNVAWGFRYQFDHGFAKGLFVIGDVKYTSKSLVNLGSGKSINPGPASATSGSTVSMYYVAATNTTYASTAGTDPKIAGELKVTATPVNNVPFPGNGLLPYPQIAAGTVINYPVGLNGQPLPLANPAVPGVYTGEPTGVFVDDGREYNFNAPYAIFDVGTGYSWKTRKLSHTVQLNVKNVGNRAYTYGSGVPGAPFQIIGSYCISY